MANAIDKMRAICAKLPDVTEAPHHGRIAFKVGGRLFATASETIVGLAPAADRRKALIDSGQAKPYARDKRAVEIDVTGKVDWKLIEQCVFDSYTLIADTKKPPKKSAASKKSAPKKR